MAVNDLGSLKNFAYLLKYDTAYGVSPFDITVNEKNNSLIVDGKEVFFVSEKDPAMIPWKKFEVDIVVESTGLFTSAEKAQAHITAGAKRVVVSAPIKDAPDAKVKGATILMAMNESKMETCQVTSNASCTTNAGSPLIAILDETLGIEKALLNTVHGYTASQALVDGPSKKDLREGRAAAQNIVPSSTGAAIAVTEVATQLKGKFDGTSLRVPTPTVSIIDFVIETEKGPLQVTMSVGIAAFPDHGRSSTEVMRAADAALFAAPTPASAAWPCTRADWAFSVYACASWLPTSSASERPKRYWAGWPASRRATT